MKRLTKPGREKLFREMIEIFKKHHVFSNIDIVYNNKLVSFGTSDLTKESNYEQYNEPTIKITPNKLPSNYGGNDHTFVVMYDGGPLYSCMYCEFGWEWKEKLMDDLERIFGPYHLGIEEINNVSFTLIDDVVPSYERTFNKLVGG